MITSHLVAATSSAPQRLKRFARNLAIEIDWGIFRVLSIVK